MSRPPNSVAKALAFGIVALILAATITPAYAQRGLTFPPNSNPYGKSYGDWSIAWWQWALSIPTAENPLFDETGALCDQAQSGPVWYLAGIFNVSGTAHRSCSVPKGRAIFFPLLNVEWDNICPPDYLTFEQERDLAASITDLITDLICEIDGVAVPNPFRFRTQAGPFSLTIPDGNIYQAFGCEALPGTYAPVAGDGYYVMLQPLPKGHHTIHFGGTIGPPIGFTLDIVYDIEVVEPHGAEAAGVSRSPSPIPQPWFMQARSLKRGSLGRTAPSPDIDGAPRAMDVMLGPSPLRDDGMLRFTTSQPGYVRVQLFDLSGRMVRTLVERTYLAAGTHEFRVDSHDAIGGRLAPAMYFYSIETDHGVARGRFAVLK